MALEIERYRKFELDIIDLIGVQLMRPQIQSKKVVSGTADKQLKGFGLMGLVNMMDSLVNVTVKGKINDRIR